MKLEGQKILITGGSRGLGLGLGVVEALVEARALVTVVARDPQPLEAIHKRLDVTTVSADVTDRQSAGAILRDVNPSVLILNAGAAPAMRDLRDISWTEFSNTWQVDVQAGLYWIQAALKGAASQLNRVFVVSSGAAVNGSPRSGGYAGAKRMLWLMADYANGICKQNQLNLEFKVVVPRQIVLGTGTGNAGATAYAQAAQITPEEFVQRLGAPMTAKAYGENFVRAMCAPEFANGIVFAINGEGISVMQGHNP